MFIYLILNTSQAVCRVHFVDRQACRSKKYALNIKKLKFFSVGFRRAHLF